MRFTAEAKRFCGRIFKKNPGGSRACYQLAGIPYGAWIPALSPFLVDSHESLALTTFQI